jgi:hypothetical protein
MRQIPDSFVGVLTFMHLQTARKMPHKESQAICGEPARKYAMKAKRERKAIARYYQLIRTCGLTGYGPSQASVAHRYGVVVTASAARSRIKVIEEQLSSPLGRKVYWL